MTTGLADRARQVLEAAWHPDGGYASPNLETYPWSWLWDSCFHAVIWASLGDRRASVELEAVFRWQTDAGFVPHMGYQLEPEAAIELWDQPGASTITQPPMWGHAARCLSIFGMDLPEGIHERMWRGFEWLWEHRLRNDLLVLCHPWESGCDDSARWAPAPAAEWDRSVWRTEKLRLVAALAVQERAAVANPAWEVGSIGFNALVAFNVRELLAISPRPGWEERVTSLEEAIAARWRPDLRTWVDDPPGPGAEVPVLDALLPMLVGRPRPWDLVTEVGPLAAPFGPRYLPADHPSFDPDTYWRGPAWPQLTYLLWVAARRAGQQDVAAELAGRLVGGAQASGWAEYWNPDTGAGRGAAPQSWTGLAAVVSGDAGAAGGSATVPADL